MVKIPVSCMPLNSTLQPSDEFRIQRRGNITNLFSIPWTTNKDLVQAIQSNQYLRRILQFTFSDMYERAVGIDFWGWTIIHSGSKTICALYRRTHVSTVRWWALQRQRQSLHHGKWLCRCCLGSNLTRERDMDSFWFTHARCLKENRRPVSNGV
jgi:hypothetical protein